jgi:hypothetical protein
MQQHTFVSIHELLLVPDDQFVMLPIESFRHLIHEETVRQLHDRAQLEDYLRKLDLHPDITRKRAERRRDKKLHRQLKRQSEPECMCTIL